MFITTWTHSFLYAASPQTTTSQVLSITQYVHCKILPRKAKVALDHYPIVGDEVGYLVSPRYPTIAVNPALLILRSQGAPREESARAEVSRNHCSIFKFDT